METDRHKWNTKHASGVGPGEPLELVRQFVAKAPMGRALDLACGRGRHALFLAELGFQVDAVDISEVALEQFEHERIHKHLADLDHYSIATACYSLIVCTYFLDRRLFPALQAGLIEGGLLLFETFTVDSSEHTHSRFKLSSAELAKAFPLLMQCFYEEHHGLARLAALQPIGAQAQTR